MHRISTGLAAGLMAAAVVGCGTVHAGQSGSPGHTNAPGTAATPRAAATPPTVAGCHGVASMITQADSGKTFCVRVGHTVDVFLRSTQGDLWFQPLASSGVLKPVPNGAASLVAGATEGSFAAVRPGRAFVTSVRPPCQAAVSVGAKSGGLEPSDTIPRSYPLRLCPAANRFSVWIIVES